jgi:hypothetical protein
MKGKERKVENKGEDGNVEEVEVGRSLETFD